MDALHLRAAKPAPFIIFGKKLKPFSLWHEIILQRFGNKFSIESEETPTLYDLLTAIYICSHSFDEDFTLDGFKIPWRVRLFGKVYIKKGAELLSEYLRAHTETPDYSIVERGGTGSNPFGAPFVYYLLVSLMGKLGMGRVEALSLAYSDAVLLHLCWEEKEGNIYIIDEREQERIEYCKQMDIKMREDLNGALS